MDVVRVELLAELFQRRHPGHRQVAVLQRHPGPVLDRVVDHAGRDGPLALTERNRVELVAVESFVVGEFEKRCKQKKYDRNVKISWSARMFFAYHTP